MNLRDLKKKLSLHRRVPELHAIIVEKDGQVLRLAGPGYVRINRLNENFGPIIRTGPQSPVQVELQNVRSGDGLPFSVKATVFYGFNPHKCNLKTHPHLVRNAPAPQQGILGNFAKQEIRNGIGKFKAEQLRLGNAPEQLETQLKPALRRKVLFAGIDLYRVVITEIAPPAKWDAAILERTTKKEQMETEFFVTQKQAELSAMDKRINASAAAEAITVQADARAHEKRVINGAEIDFQRLFLELLDSLSPEVATEFLHSSVIKELAANGGAMNLISSLPAPYSAWLAPLMAQQMSANGRAGIKSNGKSKV